MTSVALTILYAAEPVVMVIAMIALLRSREQRRFPALFAYLSLRLGSSVLLHFLLQIHRFVAISEKAAYAWYFYAYWLSYIAGAIVVFVVIQEMFQSSMVGNHILPLGGLHFICCSDGGFIDAG
jgi:hypothetical protein